MSHSMALSPGIVLGQDFEIIRLLGQGGMGTVYEAVQRTTGAPRAVKVMRGTLATDPRFRARFEQEARVSARIASDHVVQVVSAGVDEATLVPWFAMELLEGEDLGRWLERRGAMPLAEARLVAGQLGHALAAAHAVGVVHRDLKPENVFLSRSRMVGVPFLVKVLDFGVAKVISEARASTVVVGTPLYMAPEQTMPTAQVGPQADVWALGLLLFRLLTGHAYWRAAENPEGGQAMLWREVLIDTLPTASRRAAEVGAAGALPAGFDGWFARCVSREIEGRFPDAGAAASELESVMADVGRATLAGLGIQTTGRPVSAPADVTAYQQTQAGLLSSLTPSQPVRFEERRARLTFRERGERVILDVVQGTTVLDASLRGGIAHYHDCGGRGRCTTCRVVVQEGGERLGPRTEVEERVAQARKWPASIRLACQVKVLGDAVVRRLVTDAADMDIVNASQTSEDPHEERAVVASVYWPALPRFVRQQFAHDAVHVLNRYLRQACELALANRGQILRYEGSGVLLKFVADNPERAALDALRVSLRLGARVRQLNGYVLKHFGHAFDVFVGLHLGQLLTAEVGHASRVERLSFGEAIDGAQRASLAACDQGIAVAATAALCAPTGDKLLLGKEIPLEGYEKAHEVLDFAKPDTVLLVQTAFEKLAGREEAFSDAFYERLFEIHPPAEALFASTDMTVQKRMLVDTLAAAVKGLDDMEALKPVLRDLGQRHVAYGAKTIHYKYVGQALIGTLEAFLEGEFSAEVNLAWIEVYGAIARTMIEAAQEAPGHL